MFPADARSVRAARQFVLDAGWSHDEATSLRLATVVSELVTNAVLHARTPFKVKISAFDDSIRIDVSDQSPNLPMRRPYQLTEITGRGLHIVEKLADRWGVAQDGPGKTVWFELCRVPATC